MERFVAHVDVDGDRVVVATDRWRERLPAHLRYPVVMELAELLGVAGALDHHDHEPMQKGGPTEMGEVPDPRYGELLALIERARLDWSTWGARLTERVTTLLDRGQLLPMTERTEGVLRALFDEQRLAVLVTFTGPGNTPRARVEQLIRSGLIDRTIVERGGMIEIAYRLGRGLDLLRQHERPIPDRAPRLEAALREALEVKLDARDQAAVAYARKRVGQLIRIPLERPYVDVDRLLTDEEAGSLRATVAQHVEGGSRERLKARLQDAVNGTRITNDLDRIIRTELQFVHGYGAYTALKDQAKKNLGEDDPLVYRVASVNACRQCLRIWGPPTAPRHYRLSELEAWEAQGGNFHLPAAEWGPTIGPVHPNCMCAPVAYYNPAAEDAIQRAVRNILKAARR